MKKILAVLAAASMLLALASCGGKGENDGDKTNETTQITTQAESETTVSDTQESETEVTEVSEEAENETSAQEEENKLPSTKAEILAQYTLVMNKANEDKPGFSRVEYQSLPEEGRVISSGEALINTSLNVAGNFTTTKEKAEKNPEVFAKGGDMSTFPLRNCPVGCLLTDADFLTEASCKELPDGNVELTMGLSSEINPEPTIPGTKTARSKTGSVLTPLSKTEIDEKLNGSIVSAVCKDITYQLKYHDCKVTIVYNPNSNQIISYHQETHVSIKGSGKVLGVLMAVENQELIDHIIISNTKY